METEEILRKLTKLENDREKDRSKIRGVAKTNFRLGKNNHNVE